MTESARVTPREAFAEFEEIERRFGMDTSPLFRVLHALIEQGERLEAATRALEAKMAVLSHKGS